MRAASRIALAAAILQAAGCGAWSERAATVRITKLRTAYQLLHLRFEEAAAKEPFVAEAAADHGQVILAIRSGLIEQIAVTVASRYLDNVALDLGGVHAHSRGKLHKQTFLGKIELGEWTVRVELGSMVGRLRAGEPTVSLRAPDLIGIDLPVDVLESAGEATLHFAWSSKGVANAVCRDFESAVVIRGRVVPQRHHLSGALQLKNTGQRLTGTPIFPRRKIPVRIDLADESWTLVENAMRSQDTFSRCGLFMNPDDGLKFLRALAAKGILVKLPDSIFRAVHLPARFQQSVQVNHRPVGLEVTAETLRVERSILWSSVSIGVQTQPKR